MTCFSRPVFGWCLFDGVCVHCAVHGQHGLESFMGLWVGLLSGYIVSLTGGFRPFFWGVAYFGCVGSVGPLVPVGFTPLRGVHVRSINPVVFGGPSHREGGGELVLKRASRLDAFSGYPSRT